MASKKHIGAEGHEEEENSERWLLTYSDMITLLLALFIILYSMSTIDAKKVAKMAENFGTSLNNGPTTSATAGAKAGTGTGSGKGTGTGTGVPMDALDEIYGVLQDYVTKNNLQNQVGLVNTDTYVKKTR